MTSPQEVKRTLRTRLRAAAEEVAASMHALHEAVEHMNRELDAQAAEETRQDAQWSSLSTKRKQREEN